MTIHTPIADTVTARALERAAPRPKAATEARRLVLLVELEHLSTADLVELSGFLNALLGSREDPAETAEYLRAGVEPEQAGDLVSRAVSVRTAYAFGDWPPRLEAVQP